MDAHPRHRRFALSVFTDALLLAVVVAIQLPATAYSSPKQLTVVRDDRQLWQRDDAARENALGDMQAQGVDVVQIFINWDKVAPEPDALTKPSFNESDSTTYGSAAFSGIDAAVRSATGKGFKIMINPVGPAPAWASTNKGNNRFRGQYPSLKSWSRFVRAVARRYNGRFDPGDGLGKIPAVRWWGVWNEPNFGSWLQPQWRYSRILGKRIPRSPHLYRSLYIRAIKQIRKAKVRGVKFFLFDLGPVGDIFRPGRGRRSSNSKAGRSRKLSKSNIEPKRWLYEFFCLDQKGRPLRGRERRARGCPKKFRKINAYGIAHHPHLVTGNPFSSSRRAPGLTLQNTGKLITILNRAARRNRVRRKIPIYFTEFGIQTKADKTQGASMAAVSWPPGPEDKQPEPPGPGGDRPPGPGGKPGKSPSGPGGVSDKEQAQYINETEYLNYKYSRVRAYSQYPWVDDPTDSGARGWRSGLYSSSHEAKPSYDAFRLPIFVSKRGCDRVAVWGRVRPRTGSNRVEIQSGSGSSFATVKTVTVKNSRKRYFKTSISRAGACREQWRLLWVDEDGTSYTSRTTPASRYR